MSFEDRVKHVSNYVFLGSKIPDHMVHGLAGYLEDGIRPGHFLSYVIDGNLRGAIMNADSKNMMLLHVYASYLYHHAPVISWGYDGACDRWVSHIKEGKANVH